MNKKKSSKNAKEERKKKNNFKIISNIFILAIIILLILIVKNIYEKNILIGSWTIDGHTIYEFNSKGNGVLIVPSASYNFTYKIKRGKIYIDFKSENAKDADYEYSIKKNVLTIKGINNTTGEYTLRKR